MHDIEELKALVARIDKATQSLDAVPIPDSSLGEGQGRKMDAIAHELRQVAAEIRSLFARTGS